jgi:hypothetical protein
MKRKCSECGAMRNADRLIEGKCFNCCLKGHQDSLNSIRRIKESLPSYESRREEYPKGRDSLEQDCELTFKKECKKDGGKKDGKENSGGF